jgi:RHS repeat-associated protein
MYQGGRQDPITQLYHFDHRDYSTTLGTWTSQEPDGYVDGANTYQFAGGNPANSLDPQGESHRGGGGNREQHQDQQAYRSTKKGKTFVKKQKCGRDAQQQSDRRNNEGRQICKAALEGAAAGAGTAVVGEIIFLIIIGSPVGL